MEHINQCHALFAAGLKLAGDRMAEAVFSLRPDLHTQITPFFSTTEEPLASILQWKTNREHALDLIFSHQGLFPAPPPISSSADSPWTLPLRSAARGRAATHPGKRPREETEEVNPGKRPGTNRTYSDAALHMWIARGEELYVSGKVWLLKKVATQLKVKINDYCWPVILSLRVGETKLKHCESRGIKGHESLSSAAHCITGFNMDELVAVDGLWRYPTRAEKKGMIQLAKQTEAGSSTARPPVKGKGKGGRGKGRGRLGGRVGRGGHFQ